MNLMRPQLLVRWQQIVYFKYFTMVSATPSTICWVTVVECQFFEVVSYWAVPVIDI